MSDPDAMVLVVEHRDPIGVVGAQVGGE